MLVRSLSLPRKRNHYTLERTARSVMTPRPICIICRNAWTDNHKCSNTKHDGRSIVPPPLPFESSLSVDDIAYVFTRYSSLINRLYSELICSLAPCWCGADIDQFCIGQYGRGAPGSIHADRRVSAEIWRKNNPREWRDLKEQWFKHLIRLRKDGLL